MHISDRHSKSLKTLALGGALVLLLAACDIGTLSGGGSGQSPISEKGSVSLSIETQALCATETDSSCANYPVGGRFQTVSGEFKDTGTSPSWPYGVSMKFNGAWSSEEKRDLAVQLRGGADCTAQETSEISVTSGETCWVGLVGYRSTDTRHYPNSTECGSLSRPLSAAVASVIGASFSAPGVSEGVNRLEQNLQKNRGRVGNENLISGVALLSVFDSNNNGRIDQRLESGEGDAFSLVSVNGPYSCQPDLGGGGGGQGYVYATCPGGTMSSESFYANPLSQLCRASVRSGNLKIKFLPTTTSTTTAPTLP